jgi:phytoene dehydrogenase-like protein
VSTVEETSFDGVIIGAGHNGLIAAAYLAKAGLKVGIFEFRPNAGGGFATEELTAPGFKHNIHAIYCKLHDSPVHGDLELNKYGASYVFPEVKHAFVDHDRYQAFYQGITRNYESISRISAKDAETYLNVAEKWNRWYLDFILPEMYSPPKSRDQFEAEIRKKPGGDEYLKVIFDYTPMEYAAELFETDICRWYLIRCCLYAEYSPFSKGIPAIVFAHLVNHYAGKTALMRGGTRAFAEAVALCVEDQGGQIFLNQPVAKILVENGASTGVVLQDGREIRAKQFVISTIDPVHTFLFMIEERDLPREVGDRAAAFYSLIGTAKLNGIDPELYLRTVLARIASHPVNRIDELLPWNLAAELDSATRAA